MSSKRTIAIALAAAAVSLALTTTSSAQTSDPGLVARKLGSPDPLDTARADSSRVHFASSTVASTLGSQDPRDTADVALLRPSVIASDLGTPDARDAVPLPKTASPSVFSWRDFGIGVALGVGIAAAIGGFLILAASIPRGRRTARYPGARSA